MKISDIIELIGKDNLKDGSTYSTRFRAFIEQRSSKEIKDWLDECIEKCSGARDPYNRAFQDLIVSLGKRLGFEVEYGRYLGKRGEENYDGIWKRENGDVVVLEVKTSTWPIGSVNQLGGYMDRLSSREGKNVFGLYVIGKGDIQPLIEQIMGSKYRDKIRVILYSDLVEVVYLKEKLELVIGEKQAVEKVQEIILPVESINIGNVVKLISEIVAIAEEPIEEQENDEIWAEEELLSFLESVTPYQKLLLAALAQTKKEPLPVREVVYLMNKIAKNMEGIDSEISGKHVRGAKGGIKLRCKNLGKEDIIERKWSSNEKSYTLKIKERYKQTIVDWLKSESLWIEW